MSTIKVTTVIELTGPIAEGGPSKLTWERAINVGDNPRCYRDSALAALDSAKAAARADLSLIAGSVQAGKL